MKKIFNTKLLVIVLLSSIIFSVACKKEAVVGGTASSSPKVDSISPGAAASNSVITLMGSGLGNIQSIVFDSGKVNAVFNPVFNTDNTIIFRIPVEAIPAKQNIIFTNSLGVKISVPFQVLGLPTITDVSNFNWSTEYSQITLAGKNLDDVYRVAFTTGTDTAIIVSKTKSSLVLKMPTTSVPRSMLNISNLAGTITTTQEFVNLDNAYKIFTDGYGAGFENASWGPADLSTTVFKTGTKSFAATYNKGNWSADGFASWSTGVPNMPEYKSLNFWVKGGSIDYTLYITGDKRAGGYGNSDQTVPIVVPASVWTYFKIPLEKLELWKTGTPFKQLGWWIKGPDGQNETFYFDDVIFVK
ncbi:MAG TPA: hypothetical protein VF623_11300 [Segetibacter sp.]|jgi:hypothetical protein